jgi:nucleotide-binding universal stress UspA family protein
VIGRAQKSGSALGKPAEKKVSNPGVLSCSHIVDLAKLLKSDLIVVSTHNCPWFKRLMTGSDAEKIARHAPCPILIVHQHEHDFVD